MCRQYKEGYECAHVNFLHILLTEFKEYPIKNDIKHLEKMFYAAVNTIQMASKIIQWNQIDVNAISFGNLKTLENGGKIASLLHGGKPLIFQTPNLNAPYGMSKWANETTEKYSLDLSMTEPHFLEIMKGIDDKVVDVALDASSVWFKKKYSSREVVEALYTKIVKYAKNSETGEISDKYPPTFKIAVPFRSGKFECEAYTPQKTEIPNNAIADCVPKRSQVTAIVQCTGIWIAGGKFGCTFKLLQMLVSPRKELTGYAFIEDEDDM